jgi:hypothetical protein
MKSHISEKPRKRQADIAVVHQRQSVMRGIACGGLHLRGAGSLGYRLSSSMMPLTSLA